MFIISLIIFCSCIYLFIEINKQRKENQNLIKMLDEIKEKLNEKQIEEKNEENDDKKQCSIDALSWFAENIPHKIETTEEVNDFVNGLNKIQNEFEKGHLQKIINELSNENKRDLIIKLATLNDQYIMLKKITYRHLDELIAKNDELLSEETIDKIKQWADNDINTSLKISEGYLYVNNFIKETLTKDI